MYAHTQKKQQKTEKKKTLRKHVHAIYCDFYCCKHGNFLMKKILYFSYFCSKHRLWIHVRSALLRRF